METPAFSPGTRVAKLQKAASLGPPRHIASRDAEINLFQLGAAFECIDQSHRGVLITGLWDVWRFS